MTRNSCAPEILISSRTVHSQAISGVADVFCINLLLKWLPSGMICFEWTKVDKVSASRTSGVEGNEGWGVVEGFVDSLACVDEVFLIPVGSSRMQDSDI